MNILGHTSYLRPLLLQSSIVVAFVWVTAGLPVLDRVDTHSVKATRECCGFWRLWRQQVRVDDAHQGHRRERSPSLLIRHRWSVPGTVARDSSSYTPTKLITRVVRIIQVFTAQNSRRSKSTFLANVQRYVRYMLSAVRLLSVVCLWRWCTLLRRLNFSAFFFTIR